MKLLDFLRAHDEQPEACDDREIAQLLGEELPRNDVASMQRVRAALARPLPDAGDYRRGYRRALADLTAAYEAALMPSETDVAAEHLRLTGRRELLAELSKRARGTTELAQCLGTDVALVSRRLRELNELGLVEPWPGRAEDRRQRIYRVTLAGARALDRASEWAAQLNAINRIRSAVESLESATSRIRRSYERAGGVRVAEHLEANRELSCVDDALMALVTIAGTSDLIISPVVWALLLARTCLEAFLLHRLHASGVSLVRPLDGSHPPEMDLAVPPTLDEADAQRARRALEGLAAHLAKALTSCATGKDETEEEALVRLTSSGLRDLAHAARAVLDDLAYWVLRPREDPSLEVPGETSHRVIEHARELNRLSVGLGRMDALASDLCREVIEALKSTATAGVDADSKFLCAVQWIRHDNVIETVVGEGRAEEWVGVSKHRFPNPDEKNLRDIQVDVVLSRRAEVIRGPDPRFDKFLFTYFEHENLVRLFMPLVIFRNANHSIVKDNRDCWVLDEEQYRQHEKVLLSLRPDPNLTADVIGTVEAGFRVDRGETIDKDTALAIARKVTARAFKIYRYSLEYALEKSLEWLADVAGADSAALHFYESPVESGSHPYVLCEGRHSRFVREAAHGQPGTIGAPPRPDGLGRRALDERRHVVQSGEALERTNHFIYEQGVRTLVAFPMFMGRHQVVAYMHYRKASPERYRLASTELLAQRCSEVFKDELYRADRRDRDQQQAALDRLLLSLYEDPAAASRGSESVGSVIAWSVLNVLAADLVSLYEYDEAFDPEPHMAGRLRVRRSGSHHSLDAGRARGEAEKDDVRRKILFGDGPIFAEEVEEQWPAGGSEDGSPTFVERERIQSAIGVPLWSGQVPQQVPQGVLFINFRVRRHFSDWERRVTEYLAQQCGALLSVYRQARPSLRLRSIPNKVLREGLGLSARN